jgi:CheY-like chemotaxis protein
MGLVDHKLPCHAFGGVLQVGEGITFALVDHMMAGVDVLDVLEQLRGRPTGGEDAAPGDDAVESTGVARIRVNAKAHPPDLAVTVRTPPPLQGDGAKKQSADEEVQAAKQNLASPLVKSAYIETKPNITISRSRERCNQTKPSIPYSRIFHPTFES